MAQGSRVPRDIRVGSVSHVQSSHSSRSCQGGCWPHRAPSHSIWGRRQDRGSSKTCEHCHPSPWLCQSSCSHGWVLGPLPEIQGMLWLRGRWGEIQYPVLPHSGEEAFQKVMSAKPPHGGVLAGAWDSSGLASRDICAGADKSLQAQTQFKALWWPTQLFPCGYNSLQGVPKSTPSFPPLVLGVLYCSFITMVLSVFSILFQPRIPVYILTSSKPNSLPCWAPQTSQIHSLTVCPALAVILKSDTVPTQQVNKVGF